MSKDKLKFNKTLKYRVAEKCLKQTKVLGPKGKCCCNCKFQMTICGHPWVTGTSVMTPTGLYACAAQMLTGDSSRNASASDGHGLCEMWEKFEPKGKWQHFKVLGD
jgi:hypothetical protein